MAQEGEFKLDGIGWSDVVDTFELMDDWEDRYRFIIELGRKLPALPDHAYDDAHKVRGCQSQVWMISELSSSSPPMLSLRGDSDAHIVKGLIGLLLLLYSGKSPSDVLALDAKASFRSLDLEGHLSSQRANGLLAMIDRVQDMARQAA